MLRLVSYAPDGVQRFPISRSPLTIGSDPSCEVVLAYRGVADRHARLWWDGEELRIEDLGSRRGVLVAGRKVREASLELLDEVRVGPVTLLVEDAVADGEARDREETAPDPSPAAATVDAEKMIAHLARVTEWVLTDVDSRTTSEALVGGLLEDFGGGVLVLLHGSLEEAGIKLLVASHEGWLASGGDLVEQTAAHLAASGTMAGPSVGGAFEGTLADEDAWICFHFFVAVERPYVLLTAFPRYRPEAGWSPVASLRALGDLIILGLVHHVGWYEPILPGQPGRSDLVLLPGVAVGESPAIERVLGELRAAIDPPVHLLLRGEPGSGREALARSLHLSGPRRDGPFVAATCGGAQPFQLEADLFGAEVPGREGPVRREGKLLRADGGTLYLDEVDRLPLELQARLVRFLRSGEVDPAGSRRAEMVDVRVIAASRAALEPLARRDLFRVDLAYRLSQLAIDVPPLRTRREDLPLLVQTAVNRFCHETGKRMAGITVKAMSALLAYDYPGNLAELESVVRQLVHVCPSGRPIDLEMLPEKVRLATVRREARIEPGSDLELDRLVSETEEAAIREALTRTAGNKSQAARLLGLSRNGLGMKMDRYGITA
ncbi:MAG TPA: sigma 54-interacting transcriptional regulator [Thermoanaerobaculia bacterium]|nr:sigma 54-interacting transcriptional regulator [Thermoanaerobaculia bacterium]